jgi:Flp pilus assembly protein TadG
MAFRMIFRRFAANTDANFLIMTAIGTSLLLLLSSLVIDVGRAYQTQTRLSFAADAAALAGAITFTEQQQVNSSKQTALKYYAANLPEQFASTLPLTKIIVDPGTGLVTVIPTTSMPVYLQSRPDMGVSARAAAVGGGASSASTPLEVSLVLDVTTSMAKNNKMQGMKDAAKTLVDMMLDANAQARIALVPFNNFVRLPNETQDYERWLNEQHRTRFYQLSDLFNGNAPGPLPKWRGCLINNLPPADTDDYSYRQRPLIPFNEDAAWADRRYNLAPVQLSSIRSPARSHGAKLKTAASSHFQHSLLHLAAERDGVQEKGGVGGLPIPDDLCNLPTIVPLTKDKQLLTQHIDAFRNTGYGTPNWGSSGTIGSFGVLWGWRTISPQWKNEWPTVAKGLPADYRQTKKALVFLTDGLGEMPGLADYSRSKGAYGSGERWMHPALHYTWASYGFNAKTYEQADLELDERLKKVCNTIKNKTDITIYSIGFDVLGQPGGAERAQRVLGECASQPETFHLVAGNQQLRQLFKQIGEGLLVQDSNVRLVE